MRRVDYTLRWLDTRWLDEKKADEPIKRLWQQVQEARDARDDDKAVNLCLRFLKRTDSSPDHAVLGLAYCYLGETYRLMGIHRCQEAVDAFSNARLHFALDGKQIAGDRNKGVAYWSMAIIYESLPDEWNTAMRHFHSASTSIEKTAKQARERDLDALAKELDEIGREIDQDHDALQWQQAVGDPKVEALANTLVATETRLKELVVRGDQLLEEVSSLSDQVSKATLNSTDAAEQALYAARAAGNAQRAADSTCGKIGQAAERTVQSAIEASAQVQGAADQAVEAALAANANIARVEEAIRRLEQIADRLRTPAHPPDSSSLLIVPATLTTAAKPGDYFAVQGNGKDRRANLEGEYEWIAESNKDPIIYHFRRINNQILLVPVEQGEDEERPVQLSGQIVGVLRKVS